MCTGLQSWQPLTGTCPSRPSSSYDLTAMNVNQALKTCRALPCFTLIVISIIFILTVPFKGN